MEKQHPKKRYVRKYKKGHRITGMTELDMCFDAGEYIYWNHKPQHPSWLMSMQYNSLKNAVKQGILFTTKENK